MQCQVSSDRNIVCLSGVIRLHSYLGRKIVQTPGLTHCIVQLCKISRLSSASVSPVFPIITHLYGRDLQVCRGVGHLQRTPGNIRGLTERSQLANRKRKTEGRFKTWQSNLCRRQMAHLTLFFCLTTKMNIEQTFKSFTTLIKFYLGQAGPNDLWDKSKHLEIN